MKVFLLENVANLGQKGDIKEVSEGYARNFLIAKNLACLVQDKRAKAVLEEKQAHYKEQKIIKKELDLKAQSLQGKVFKFSAKADKNGRLFGSIGPKELAKETGLSENLFKEHFKQVGTFTLNIEISPENFVKIQIVIEKEK